MKKKLFLNSLNYYSLKVTQFPPPSFPPLPSAPGGGGDPGHSGRRGKLYLATQAARDAAARRKEDRVNVLLSLPSLAPPSTPLNRATCYKKCSDEKSLSEAPPATIIPGERIIFDELTAVAKTPFESLPPVVASPALQQSTGVELPALLQFPVEVLNEQPPATVDKTPTQECDALLSTVASGNDIYERHKEEELVQSSNDEEVVKSTCAASQLCRDPNNDTDNYCCCLNCNVEAHLICTEQMNFQTPALDKLVINHRNFSFGGKER